MQNFTKIIAATLFLAVSQAALAITAVPDVFFITQDESDFLNVFGNDDIDFNSWVSPVEADIEILDGDATIDSFSTDGLGITPAPGYVGSIGLLYTITDGSGTSQTTISIEVQATGTGDHEAVPDIFYVDVDETAELYLTANDNYIADNGYPTVIVGTQSAEGGQVQGHTFGDPSDATYTPAPGFVGVDTVVYELQDGMDPGVTSTSAAVIYVGVDPNAPPPGETFEPIAGLDQEEQQTFNVIVDICSGEESGEIPCEEIAQLDDSQTRDLVQQISGRHTKLQSRTMRESRSEQSGNVRSRLKEIRGGVNRVSVGNLNAAVFGKSVPVASLLQNKLNDELQGGSAGDGDLTTPWGFFVNGNITLGEAKSRNSRPDYEQDGYNITMGADYRLSDKLVAGLAAGYSRSDMDFSRDFGSQESDSYSLSLFGNYYPRDNIYVDGLLMLVNGGMDVERRISAGPISQELASDTDSQQIVLSSSVGYEYSIQRFQGSVYGRLEYSDLTIDGYRETGDTLALAFAEQNTSSFDGAIGTRLGYVFNLSRGVVVPNLEVEYVTRQEDDYTIEGRFLNAPSSPSFSLDAEEADTEHLNLSTSVSAIFSGGRSGFFRYERMLMQDNYEMSSYSLGFRMEF